MVVPLLSTKTYLPQPVEGQVIRARLRSRLDQFRHSRCRLILVSSMAGSGKSAMLADWASSSSSPVSWLSLDAHDNRLPIFWAYLISSIQRQHPGFAQNLLADVLSPQPPDPQALLTEFLVQAEQLPAPVILVLDDYHVIENQDIHTSMVYLIEHLPGTLLPVVCTRSDPPFPLSRWRVRGNLLEIRARDLRFNSDEVAQFFRDFMRLSLDDEDLNRLETSTEGWAAGLQLAALALQGSAASVDNESQKGLISRFSANHQHVLEYLTSEVLNQQAFEIREFLLQTSILNQLNGELCDAVTGNPNSVEILVALQQKNLFIIPQDAAGVWFRYHHLFADMLRIRLARQGAEAINDLHLRAAKWYAQAGRISDCLHHALQARAYAYAADVVNQNWRKATDEGWPNLALEWLEALPTEEVKGHPMLSMAFAWTQWVRGRAGDALSHGEDALRAYEHWRESDKAPTGNFEYDTIPCQVSVLRALVKLRQERFDESIEHAREAIRLSQSQAPFAAGLAHMALATALRDLGRLDESIESYQATLPLLQKSRNRITVTNTGYNLGRLLQIQGRLDEAESFLRSVLEQASQMGANPADGILRVGLGEVLMERNQIAQAGDLYRRAWEQAGRGGYLELIKNGCILKARLNKSSGDLMAAVDALKEGLELLRRSDARSLIAETQSELARYQAEAGLMEDALVWVKGFQLKGSDHVPSVAEGIQLLNLARVHLLVGNAEPAALIASQFAELAVKAGSIRWQAEALLIKACVQAEKGQLALAQKYVYDSLALTVSRGYLRIYIDAGLVIRDQLTDIYPDLTHPEMAHHAAEILDAFSTSASVVQRSAIRMASGTSLVEPLSEREVQVLRLISLGMTNQEVADKLVISLPTTKTHVRHILEKLSAQNRVEAIHRGKDLGLL